MGNTFGYDQDLNVFIQTEKPYYNSGSSIEGAIFVDAQKPCFFDALYLRVQGTEYCQWSQGSSLNLKKHVGQHRFYVVEHIIKKFQAGVLSSGKLAFPFSLELSDNIPGSFESSARNAKIEYYLIAYFANYLDRQTVIFQKKIEIREPFRQNIQKFNGQVQNKVNRFLGKTEFQVDYDRNVAFEKQQINIVTRINNIEGNRDIRCVNAQLVEYTFVCSNENVCRNYRKVIAKEVINKITKKGQNGVLAFKFQIPKISYQTTISTLVSNYHRVEVSIDLGYQKLCINAPVFLLKLNLERKQQQLKNNRFQEYVERQPIFIRSKDYNYKKHRNLQIINFKNLDLLTQLPYRINQPI